MSNSLAIWLIALICAALAVDCWQYDWAGSLFLARKGLDLLQWVAFWR